MPGPISLRRLAGTRAGRLASRAAWRWQYRHGPRLMSSLRRRWLLLSHPHTDIRFEGPVHLGPRFSLHAPLGGTLVVGAGTQFRRGFHLELGHEARVTIGRDCVFTHDALIQCSTSIDIGDRCNFGQALMIIDGNHRYRDIDVPLLEQGYDFRPIRIGDDATVLTKCTVLADLGRKAVVAANAVVLRPVPDYTVVGGVPARELEYYGPPRAQQGGQR